MILRLGPGVKRYFLLRKSTTRREPPFRRGVLEFTEKVWYPRVIEEKKRNMIMNLDKWLQFCNNNKREGKTIMVVLCPRKHKHYVYV